MNNFFDRLSQADLQKVLTLAYPFVTPKEAANMKTANKMYNWSHRFFSLVNGKAGRSFEDGIMTLVFARGCDESAKISKALKKSPLEARREVISKYEYVDVCVVSLWNFVVSKGLLVEFVEFSSER